jgi:uncharacterized membrane protein
MKSARVIGLLFLGVWLLLWGLLHIFPISIPLSDIVLGVIAVAAGILVLLGL